MLAHRPPPLHAAGCARRRRRVRAAPHAALRLEPCGDGTTDHLPADARGASAHAPAVELPRRGGSLLLGRGTLWAGRSGVGTVNSSHAKLEVTREGDVFVSDLGSRNGTTLDGCARMRVTWAAP